MFTCNNPFSYTAGVPLTNFSWVPKSLFIYYWFIYIWHYVLMLKINKIKLVLHIQLFLCIFQSNPYAKGGLISEGILSLVSLPKKGAKSLP